MDPTDREPTGTPARRFQLGLGESMLWVALAAVCSAALSVSIILAVIAALVLAPTLARTLRIIDRRKALGRPIDANTWTVAAVGSTGVVLRTWTVAVLGGVGGWLLATLVVEMVIGGFAGTFPRSGVFHPALAAAVGRVGVVTAALVFLRSARVTWAIRDHEVGRALGPGSDSDPDGGIPC